MNRETWALIRHNKNFNVHVFRRGLSILIVMLILNSLLLIIIFWAYLSLPEPDFYETNGVSEPMKLTPLATANFSSTALLEPDPLIEDSTKEIPQ